MIKFENILDLEAEENGDIVVIMRYIPNLSVNHYKYRNRFTRPEVKKWMDDLTWAINFRMRSNMVVFNPPVKVKLKCTFKNLRSACDSDNLLKVINDSVKKAIGIDDKFFTNTTEESVINPKEYPHLKITISQGG